METLTVKPVKFNGHLFLAAIDTQGRYWVQAVSLFGTKPNGYRDFPKGQSPYAIAVRSEPTEIFRVQQQTQTARASFVSPGFVCLFALQLASKKKITWNETPVEALEKAIQDAFFPPVAVPPRLPYPELHDSHRAALERAYEADSAAPKGTVFWYNSALTLARKTAIADLGYYPAFALDYEVWCLRKGVDPEKTPVSLG